MIIFLIACVLLTAWPILRVSQGLYEDHTQMIALQGARPPLVVARGLARLSLWVQAQYQQTPVAIRVFNLWLGVLVALAVGWLAHGLGLTSWPAIGVMLLHPLRTETMAQMSGRYELIAALGVVLACVCVARTRVTGWHLLGALSWLGLGWLGKETALVGVPLVALTLWTMQARGLGRRFGGRLVATTILVLIVAAVSQRHLGWTNAIHGLHAQDWFLVQSTAAWRLLTMLIMPQHQTVDFDYDSLGLAIRIGAMMGLMCSVVGLCVLWRMQRMLAYAVAWPLVTILPRLIIQTPKSYLNEHQMFLGLVGIALAVAYGHARLEAWCSVNV